MITMNKDLFLWIFLISLFITAILKIIVGIGCNGDGKEWGYGDVLDGILWIILIIIVLIT